MRSVHWNPTSIYSGFRKRPGETSVFTETGVMKSVNITLRIGSTVLLNLLERRTKSCSLVDISKDNK